MKMSKPSSSRSTPDNPSRYWAWGAVLLVVLFTAAIRVRLLSIPLERDEGEFAYLGQLMLQGVPPYAEAYNMKLPGIYAAYAAIMAVFGQTVEGIHLGLLFVNAATIILVFLLARRLFDAYIGVVACATFALLSVSPSILGLAAHATHFVLLPALGGILLVLRAINSDRMATLFWSGLLLGLGFVMKQPGIFFIIFAALYLIWNQLQRRPVPWRRLMLKVLLFSLGALMPFGLTCVALFMAGVFDRFWFWTFTYGAAYASRIPVVIGSRVLSGTMPEVVGSSVLLWGIATIGLTAFFWNKKLRPGAVFSMGFFVFSFFAVCPGLYFRYHYFILLLPAVALLAGVGTSSLRQLLLRVGIPTASRAIPILLFVAAFGYSVSLQRAAFFELSPLQVCRRIYSPNPFAESLEIAKYIKAHTNENDRIAVLGSEPQIYFYSNRRSATGYIYMYGLMENHRYALKMQQEMIREIETSRPKFLVWVDLSHSWKAGKRSEKQIFRWSEKYGREHFDLVGVINIIAPDWTEYYWDDEAARCSLSTNHIYVLERKPSS